MNTRHLLFSRLKHVEPPTSGVFAILLSLATCNHVNQTENDDLTETFGLFWAFADEEESRMMTAVNNGEVSLRGYTPQKMGIMFDLKHFVS